MFDFAARDNSDFKGLVAQNGAANSAVLMKAVEVSVDDVKGELYSTYWLKYFELSNCVVCFSAQIALGLRFWMVAKKTWNAKTIMSILELTFRRYLFILRTQIVLNNQTPILNSQTSVIRQALC